MVYLGGETTDGKRVYIGNINYEVREEELRNAFSEYGQITAISYKQGYAFIDYADKRDAQDAIKLMEGKILADRKLTPHLQRALRLAGPAPWRLETLIGHLEEDAPSGQEALLDELHVKVKDVYEKCGFESGSNPSTIFMLSELEARLEDLLSSLAQMPEIGRAHV